MSKRQSGRLISLAVGGLIAAGPVLAEPSPAPDATLEEVIVTSQKVARDLQDTPAAVTALSGADLLVTGVSDLRGAQMYVPQVRFQAQGNNTQVFVRGVGTGLDLPNIEPSVGFIVNGAYVPREASSAALFDVAQLEVLPGPQGTLYGRSAIGGTVGVTFNRPTQDNNGSILMEAGNYSFGHVGYAQNLPLGEDFAARVAVDSNYREGYMASGADSRRDNGIRVSGLYTPGETLSLYAWAQYLSKGGHPANLVNKGFDPATGEYSENAFLRDDPWNDTRTGDLEPLAIFGQPQGDQQRYDTFMAGAELGWTLGQVRMTYIPAYLWLDSSPQ
ncbi:MAG: TonB-dependent receptor plug domain-containing protein, partial [Steroidobacteraceae bacterium]|nr:TonB-dependent receptor plug domain-containing protein [Steroidobacteraceae bacterium]